MKFKTHVVGGLSAGVVANSFLMEHTNVSTNPGTAILLSSLFVAGSVIGSITPDIDHRGSYIGKRMKITSFLFKIFGGITSFVQKINYKLFGIGDKNGKTMISHRGITHTPILVFAIVALLLFTISNSLTGINSVLLSYLSIGFGVGMLSHILLDSITTSGVPLLYPFTTKQFSFLPIKTGGKVEILVRITLIILTLYFISNHYGITDSISMR